MTTKDELLARAQAGRIKAVTVAGLELHIRRFSLAERIEAGTRARAGEALEAHEYLAMGLCNEDGSPLFTLDEAREFCDGDGVLAELVVNEVLDHAGLTAAAQERAAKN